MKNDSVPADAAAAETEPTDAPEADALADVAAAALTADVVTAEPADAAAAEAEPTDVVFH